MSVPIKIDTAAVKSAARQLSGINTDIRNLLSDVSSKVRALDNSWSGDASECAIGAFGQIRDAYSEERYAVIENYINILNEQVGEGYESTESVNKSLADAFK